MFDPRRLNRIGVALALALLLAVAVLSVCPAAEQTGRVLKLTILHLNDVHGHYEPYPEDGSTGLVGGLAKAKTVIEAIRTENQATGRNTLVLLAGDLFTGTVFSEASRGVLESRLLNAIDFTAMTVGNHEFDYGVDPLFNHLKLNINFPLLGANIKDEFYRPQFDLVKESALNGTRLVIFGLTTRSSKAKGLYFSEPVAVAKEILDRYDSKDLVIALTHLGQTEDKQLVDACPKIDVVVGGHSHDKLSPSFRDAPRPIVQAGAYARYLGRLDLEVRDGVVTGYDSRLIDLSANIKENEEIKSVLSDYKEGLASCWFAPVGKSEVYLKGVHHDGLSVDKTSPLAKLVTHVMAVHSKAQIAITNAGGIRWGLPAGEITYSDVFKVLPFRNRCVRIDLKGADLLEILRGSDISEDGYREILQTCGLTFDREAAGNLIIRKVGSEEFDPKKVYSVVTNDWLLAVFKKRGLIDKARSSSTVSHALIRDLLADFIREKKAITTELLEHLD